MRFIDQRGDTLIEVTIALTILSVVLTSAFYLSNRAIIVGRIAKERTLLISATQLQAELLTKMRDQYGWTLFKGEVDSMGAGDFHITLASGDPHLASGCTAVSNVATAQLCIKATAITPNRSQFNLTYQAQAPGGGPDLTSTVVLQLGNVDALRTVVTP